MKRRLSTLTLVTALLPSAPLFAEGESVVDLSGRLTSGVDVAGFEHGEAVTHLKLKAKTKRRQGTRIVVKVEATNLKRNIELEETYIDHKNDDDSVYELGLAKKVFGLEYELGDDDRLPINRTLLYRKLETFSYVGKETTLRWRREADAEKGQNGFQLGLGYGESLDGNVFGSYTLAMSGEWSASAWAMIQSDRINAERQLVWSTMFSVLQLAKEARTELELAVGQDPFESEFQKMFGDGKDRYYAGFKGLYGRRLPLTGEAAVAPFVGGAIIQHDLSLLEFNSLELLFGVTYHFTDFMQVAANADIVGTNSRAEPEERTYDESIVSLEAKYVF